PLFAEVRGRDLVTGLPRNVDVSSNDIVEAIQEPLRLIVGAVRDVLEETPPELAADIFDRGIVLSGGGAQLRGIDRYISMHTGIPAVVAEDRPDAKLTVFGPRSAWVHVPNATYRLLPRTRLIGRHLQWPAQIRELKPEAYFGPAGALPLGNVGCASVITVHDLAIYRNPRWFPGRQPLSTRLVVPRSVLRADRVIAVSENTAHDIVEIFGIDRARIQVVPHGVSPKMRPMSAEERADARARLKLP